MAEALSKPVVGSSNNNKEGSFIISKPMANRLLSPPEIPLPTTPMAVSWQFPFLFIIIWKSCVEGGGRKGGIEGTEIQLLYDGIYAPFPGGRVNRSREFQLGCEIDGFSNGETLKIAIVCFVERGWQGGGGRRGRVSCLELHIL